MARPFGWFRVWVPRACALCFAAFLALFALDVLGTGLGFWASLGVIALHLVPTAVVLAVLALAWRHEVAGSIAYLALAAGYLIMAAGRFHWSVIAAISGSLAGLGILFFASWWTGRHSGTTATG